MFVCVEDEDDVGCISSFVWVAGGGLEKVPRIIADGHPMFIEVQVNMVF